MTAFVNWSHLSDALTPLAFKREERNSECSNYSCPIYSFFSLSRIAAVQLITTRHMWVFNIFKFKLTKMKGNEKFIFLVTLVSFPVLSQ